MNFAVLVMLVFQIAGGETNTQNPIWKTIPLRNVSDVELPATVIDWSWKQTGELRLNDLSEVADAPKPVAAVARALASKLKPIGVRSVAEYSLASAESPPNMVTVRVFIFDNATKCQKWWKKKYEYDKSEDDYTVVESETSRIVRSIKTNKTAMAFGNVWLTTHQTQDGDEHIEAANHVLGLLTSGERFLPEPPEKPPEEKVFSSDRLKVQLTTSSSWETLSEDKLAELNANTVRPVLLHAKKIEVEVEPEAIYSKILLIQSLLPFGSKKADNPNYIFAAEKVWTDKFEKTGKGYINLMAQRVQKIGAATQFSLPPKEIKIAGNTFYYADATNRLVKNAETKQRYICGFTQDHYIYFVISYNSENDEYFKTIMSCINSLKLEN